MAFKPTKGGSLLELGSLHTSSAIMSYVELGRFTKGISEYANALNHDKRMFGYFTASGAGRLSNGLAKAAAIWVRGAILEPSERSKKIPGSSGYKTEQLYQQWKDIVFPGKMYGVLTGSMGNAFGVIKSRTGGVTLGIDPTVTTLTPVPFSGWKSVKDGDGKYSGHIKYGEPKYRRVTVTDYAALIETKKGQALFAPAIKTWLDEAFPVWAKLFENLYESEYASYTSTAASGGTGQSDEEFREGGEVNLNAAAGGVIPMANVIQKAEKNAKGSAAKINESAALLQEKSSTVVLTSKERAGLLKLFKTSLEDKGYYSSEEVADILKSIIGQPSATKEDLQSAFKEYR